jgi:gamma-glutamylcyclotransferase (GGCT)/AIG2-like uncharacterized protein YtfP
MKKYLFSYGTLLPGRAPAEIAPTVQRLRRVGRGFVRGHLYDFGEYPGAVLARTGSSIVGEVFELPDDPRVLSRLDEYEGFDPADPQASTFVRKGRFVTLKNSGKKIVCWIYAYNRPPGPAPVLSSGDYSKAGAKARP